jgi:hypothetical protein
MKTGSGVKKEIFGNQIKAKLKETRHVPILHEEELKGPL